MATWPSTVFEEAGRTGSAIVDSVYGTSSHKMKVGAKRPFHALTDVVAQRSTDIAGARGNGSRRVLELPAKI